MVKNSTGGNKSKKQGRKFAAPTEMPGGQQKVRRATEVGEMYAAITKIFGGTSCKIICIDGVTRDCIIRRKFNSAGGKRQNMLSIGTWVLVGLRDWEVRANGDQKCDLLEVYSASEKDRLKQIENNFNFKLLNIASDVSTSNNRGATIAEQSTNYDNNCDIVSFSNSLDGEGGVGEGNKVSNKLGPIAEEEESQSGSSTAESSSSAESSEDEDDDKAPLTNPTPVPSYAPAPAPYYEKNNIKKQNDWMVDIDEI